MSCRLKKAQFSCPNRRPPIVRAGKKNKNKSYRQAKKIAQANADKVWPTVVACAAALKNEHNPCQANPELYRMVWRMYAKTRHQYLKLTRPNGCVWIDYLYKPCCKEVLDV